MKTDSQIQAHVLNELLADSRISATEIGVAVSDGVVSLEGDVDSLSKRVVAERAAERVAGVRALVNHITVHLPIDQRLGDVDIALAALRALARDTEVPDKMIKVRVQDGAIHLAGEVDTESQRAAAQRAVETIAGVSEVTNLIRVRSSPAASELHAGV